MKLPEGAILSRSANRIDAHRDVLGNREDYFESRNGSLENAGSDSFVKCGHGEDGNLTV
jgi:hypothetical protein